MYDVELSNAIARHLEKEDAAERRRHHCTKCGGAIWEDTALPCSNGELICQSCAEDFRVDEDVSPDYKCSVCGDTESEDRFFFEGEYFCQKHFNELFVDAEPDD